MKKYLFAMALFVLGMVAVSCSSDDNNALQFFSSTGCKVNETRAVSDRGSLTDLYGQESITYEGTEDGYLVLYHHNARFTCETEVTASATVEDGRITIIESYNPNTNCICAYDLTMKIGPLKKGQYMVAVSNCISDTPTARQTPDFSFSINYNTSIKGEYIVNRY